MGFHKAERRRMFIKLAITGPSGSGKTYSAIQLARGLGGKIAMLDTENGSGEAYAALCDYDVLTIEAPFTVAKYYQGIREAASAGYDVLVIDSLTHAWAGEGGLLAQKEQLDARGGNSYTNWATITKQHEQFKAAILDAKIHVIATMRSKQDYVLQANERGKQTPVKVGLAPVQREGMEYEFTLVFDVAMNHEAATSKDRTGLFDGFIGMLTPNHGKLIADWLAGGAEPVAEPEPSVEPSPEPQPKAKPAPKAEPKPAPKPAQQTAPKAAEPTAEPTWRDVWPIGVRTEYRCLQFRDDPERRDVYWLKLNFDGMVAIALYQPSTDASREAASMQTNPPLVEGVVTQGKSGNGPIPVISKVQFKDCPAPLPSNEGGV